MKKHVLYAAVFGKKPRFRKPEITGPDPDKVLYTDLPKLFNGDHVFYSVREKHLDQLDPVRRNRFMKICIPDEIFYNYEYSLYMDYKHPTEINFDKMVSCLESRSDILVDTRHYHRDCVYDEGKVCIEKKKDKEKDILRQLSYYYSKGYPAHNGLYANWWIFRRHTKEVREFCKLWWDQVNKYSCRDQISLPYLKWRYGAKISVYREKK